MFFTKKYVYIIQKRSCPSSLFLLLLLHLVLLRLHDDDDLFNTSLGSIHIYKKELFEFVISSS